MIAVSIKTMMMFSTVPAIAMVLVASYADWKLNRMEHEHRTATLRTIAGYAKRCDRMYLEFTIRPDIYMDMRFERHNGISTYCLVLSEHHPIVGELVKQYGITINGIQQVRMK